MRFFVTIKTMYSICILTVTAADSVEAFEKARDRIPFDARVTVSLA